MALAKSQLIALIGLGCCLLTEATTCNAAAAIANGDVGNCTSTLASGATCAPACKSGYTASSVKYTCTAGTLAPTTINCHPKPCDASTPPDNGAVGTCISNLPSGASCAPKCNTGYTKSGMSSCTAETLAPATCNPDPCDASAVPANGAVGDCTSTLASGKTCTPTCNTGYNVSGTYSCTTGTLTPAAITCLAMCSRANTAGYDFTKAAATVAMTGFDAAAVAKSISCGTGFEGTPSVKVCAKAGDAYTVSKCTAVITTLMPTAASGNRCIPAVLSFLVYLLV